MVQAAPAADAAAPAADAAAPAADAAAAAAPANSGLPVECENYLNRAKACFAKSSGNAAAAAFQQGIDQAKAQWEAMADKSGLSAACTQANDQFARRQAGRNKKSCGCSGKPRGFPEHPKNFRKYSE